MNLQGTVDGNLTIPNGTVTNIPLQGSLYVNGSVTPDGTLAINTDDSTDSTSFVSDEIFPLFGTTGGFTGQFSTISGLPQLNTGLIWEIIYSPAGMNAVVTVPDTEFAPTTGNVLVDQSSVIGIGTTLQVSDGNVIAIFAATDVNSLTIAAGSSDETVTVDPPAGNTFLPDGITIGTSDTPATGNITLIISGGLMNFNDDVGANATNVNIEAINGTSLAFNGTQHLADLIMDATSTVTNNGTIVFAGNVDFSGETLNGGTFEITNGYSISVNDTTTLNGATLLIDSGATLNWNSGDIAGGTVLNYGIIAMNYDPAGSSWTSTIINNGVIAWYNSDTSAISGFNGTIILTSGMTIDSDIEVCAGETLIFQGRDTWDEGDTITVDSGATLDWSQVYIYIDYPVTINNYRTLILTGGTANVPDGPDDGSLTINSYGTTIGSLQMNYYCYG